MSKIVGIDGKAVAPEAPKTPTQHTYEILLDTADDDGRQGRFVVKGYLIATPVFIAIGIGDGEFAALVPMDRLVSVTKIDDKEKS